MRSSRTLLIIVAVVVATACTTNAQEEDMKLKAIRYPSSADGTQQPALFYAPKTNEPVPLVVVLHTWSGDYRQNYHDACVRWAVEKDWAVILPDFRGPNNRPEATGSELVVADILSAVEYAAKNANIDVKRIYLVGASGGGYAALLMAGRAPKLWAGVSAWVPIADLKTWYEECRKRGLAYANDVVKSCGGPPGKSPAVDLEYTRRSASTYLANARPVPLDINAGITDGHTGSVPISHSLRAFNLLAAETDRVSEADIEYMTGKAEVPPHLKEEINDPSYGAKVPLFRRVSGRARVTIFKGGHEIVPEAAMNWLEKQRKD